MSARPRTGGCQCGAVRFSVQVLGRASICHCRMCQKASGSFFGPYVTALEGLAWTRGGPTYFQSSNLVRRGFRRILGDEPDFEVVGEASDGESAVDLTCSLKPRVVSWIAACRERAASPPCAGFSNS